MRSFATFLIATAFAAFSTAAPAGVPAGLAALPKLPADEKFVGDGLTGKLNTRANPPSIAVIFDDLSTETKPYVDQLMHIDSSHLSVPEITSLAAQIKVPMAKAISQLKALVGTEPNVILAPLNTALTVELNASDVAKLVGDVVQGVLTGVGNVLNAVETDAPQLEADVDVVLSDLGLTVDGLVNGVVALVSDVVGPLVQDLQPVLSVIVNLHLDGLAHDLNLNL